MSKLYTEEQVRIKLGKARLLNMDDTEMFTDDYLIEQQTPIQLPTDEESAIIALKIADALKDKLTSSEEAFFLSGFQTYAKWMRDKIKGGKDDSE